MAGTVIIKAKKGVDSPPAYGQKRGSDPVELNEATPKSFIFETTSDDYVDFYSGGGRNTYIQLEARTEYPVRIKWEANRFRVWGISNGGNEETVNVTIGEGEG